MCPHRPVNGLAEGLHSKTGVSSLVTIDAIVPAPRFHELYDVGTGALYGNTVPSAGTATIIEATLSEVCVCGGGGGVSAIPWRMIGLDY